LDGLSLEGEPGVVRAEVVAGGWRKDRRRGGKGRSARANRETTEGSVGRDKKKRYAYLG
jgi:hypothetical protein